MLFFKCHCIHNYDPLSKYNLQRYGNKAIWIILHPTQIKFTLQRYGNKAIWIILHPTQMCRSNPMSIPSIIIYKDQELEKNKLSKS